MTYNLRMRDGNGRVAKDGDLVTDEELSDSYANMNISKQPLQLSQPMRAYKDSKTKAIRFVPYSPQKNLKKKVPQMLDQDFDDALVAARASIKDYSVGADAAPRAFGGLLPQDKAESMKMLRKLQKVYVSNGIVTSAQWAQILEELNIKSKVPKNENTTDYKDMKKEVAKRIREYAEQREKTGQNKTVDLENEGYKKYINKYLKSVRNYYIEENDLTVTPRPVHTARNALGQAVHTNLTVGPAAAAGNNRTAGDFIVGVGINPKSTPSIDAVSIAAAAAVGGVNVGYVFTSSQEAIVGSAAAGAGEKRDDALITLITPTAARPAATVASDLLNFEKSRDIITTSIMNSATKLANIPIHFKVFSDGVAYDTVRDKELKKLNDLIEKLFKIFIEQTQKYIDENPGADAVWAAFDGRKGAKKSAKKPHHKGRSGKKMHRDDDDGAKKKKGGSKSKSRGMKKRSPKH